MLSQAPVVTIQLHRQQFVIGHKPFHASENWCSRQVEQSIWLSYCPDLRVGWATDVEGRCWVILGLAIETLPERLDPLAAIAQTPSAKVPDCYSSWAGRWVLVGQGQVHMDASGLLGCFYAKASANQTWVSSSPALLACILSPDASLTVDSRSLSYEVGISWFTPPQSRFAEIGRLLPSQMIELDGNLCPRPLMPPIDPTSDYDKTLEQIKHSLITTLKRLSMEAGKLWLGLTAGFDSRLMLAISDWARVDVRPYTRVAARTSMADRLLPPKLASQCGYGHIFLGGQRAKANLDRKHLIAEHSAGHISEGDAEPLIQSVRDSLDGISFGGHGFAIASGFGDLRRLPATVHDPATGAQQIAQLFGEPTNSTATTGIYHWLQWVLKHPHEHLDWRDRFFIEQRQAGWLSSKEQVYDLSQLRRFPILNAARNYALLLGLPENQRLGSLVQVELIRRLAPELLNHPFNPEDRYFGMIQEAVIKSADDPLYVYRKVAPKLRQIWHFIAHHG